MQPFCKLFLVCVQNNPVAQLMR